MEQKRSSLLSLAKSFFGGFSKTEQKSARDFKAIALNMESRKHQDILRKGMKKPTNISFKVLRKIAKADAVTRVCINVIKKSVAQSKWRISVKDTAPNQTEGAYKAEIDKVYELFDYLNDNDENMRILLERTIEDILVLDAGAIEIVPTLDGKEIVSLNSVDGATIRPIYNQYGELGNERGIAYKQFINEKEVAEFRKEELIYLMANPQNDIDLFGYGMSPIESIILQVQASLEADMHNIKSFSGNNVPSGLLDLGNMSDTEAELFIATWNATVIGNNDAMKFVWGSDQQKKFIPFNTSNKDMQYTEYVDWLSRIKLATFGLSGIDANITQDLNRATAEVQATITQSRGVKSMKRLLEEYITRGIIRRMGPNYKFLEFEFEEPENIKDRKTQAEVDQLNILSGIYKPGYVQMRDKLPSMEDFNEEDDEKLEQAIQDEIRIEEEQNKKK